MDIIRVQQELSKNDLTIIAGTIFDDLVSESNLKNLLKQVDDICSLITKLPPAPKEEGQKFPTPYLVIIDWGHDERDYKAGHPEQAQRLSEGDWKKMMNHISAISEKAWTQYGVRPVIHPHAGGILNSKMKLLNL